MPVSEDNSSIKAANIETIFTTNSKSLPASLILENQNTHPTEGKISLSEETANFGLMEPISEMSSTITDITDPEDLMLNTEETNLKTSQLPPMPLPTTATIAAVDDNGPFESSPADKFLLNDDNKGKSQVKLRNDKESGIINSSDYDRNETKFKVPQNVGELKELNWKETKNNLSRNLNKQWQAEKKQTFTDRISTKSLASSNPS